MMNNADDEDVDEMMRKLRLLQESRHRRMCRWLEEPQNATSAPSTTTLLLQRLQHELVSLLSRDDAIFRQLLILRTSISQLKMEHQQSRFAFNEEEAETEEEDLEISYLSSSSSSGSSVTVDKRSLSNAKHECDTDDCDSFFSYSHCHNSNNTNSSEDSAISLDFSTSSSAPSPTPLLLPASNFHRHNVTYPPTRINRHSNRTSSIPQGVNVLGEEEKTCCSSSGKREPEVLVQRLVRSRSITFLPRGVLFRREESCDSGFQDTKSNNDGEIFV